MDELFADVALPASAQPPADTSQIQKRLTEILAEALTLVTQLDHQDRAAGPAVQRWAARVREPEATPERVQFMSADAPSANREKGSGASAQHDEAQ